MPNLSAVLASPRSAGLLRSTPAGVLLIAAACLPLLLTSSYDLGRYQLIVIYAIVAIGLNLSLGFGGEFVLGHVVAMGASSYAAAYCSLHFGFGFLASLGPALLVGTLIGLLVHIPGIRIMGWTLAVIGFIAVIAFADVVKLAKRWTGGEDGLIGVQRPVVFGHLLNTADFYEVSLGVLAATMVMISLLVRSSWGLRMRYLRDAPRALESVGASVISTKLFLYVASAIPAAAAGWLITFNYQYVAPGLFDFNLLTLLLAAVFIGGRGTLFGPLMGTIVVQGTSLMLGSTNEYTPVVFGLTLFLVVVLLPAGLVPSISRIAGYAVRRLVPRAERAAAGATGDTAADGPRPVVEGKTLTVSDVTKSFFGNEVLRGLTLQVRHGRLTALVGPNGSGKTTVINLVTGFLRSDHGDIRLADRDLAGMSPVQVARAGIRRTFQVPQLSLPLTVSDNVATGLLSTHSTGLVTTILRLPRFRRVEGERRARVRQACAAAAIPVELWDRPVAELSLASRRQVEVARAIVGDAAVILFDEPASGLNVDEVQKLAALLRANVGPALLVIEHNIAFVTAVADELYLLDAGVCIAHADLTSGDPLPEALNRYVNLLPAMEAAEIEQLVEELAGEPVPAGEPVAVCEPVPDGDSVPATYLGSADGR